MAGPVVLLESPVIIRPGGEKSGQEHGPEHRPGEPGTTYEQVVGEVHGGFHGDHRSKTHTDRRGESLAQAKLP